MYFFNVITGNLFLLYFLFCRVYCGHRDVETKRWTELSQSYQDLHIYGLSIIGGVNFSINKTEGLTKYKQGGVDLV